MAAAGEHAGAGDLIISVRRAISLAPTTTDAPTLGCGVLEHEVFSTVMSVTLWVEVAKGLMKEADKKTVLIQRTGRLGPTLAEIHAGSLARQTTPVRA